MKILTSGVKSSNVGLLEVPASPILFVFDLLFHINGNILNDDILTVKQIIWCTYFISNSEMSILARSDKSGYPYVNILRKLIRLPEIMQNRIEYWISLLVITGDSHYFSYSLDDFSEYKTKSTEYNQTKFLLVC